MRCLIIGLGSIAKKHIHVLETYYPQIELCAYRSAANKPSYSNVSNLYDWDLIEKQSETWDFVILSNPTYLHAELLQKIVRWPGALFVEKPLFHQLGHNAQLVQQIVSLQKLSYVACNLRFLDCLVFLKKYMESCSAKVQEVNAYCGSYLPDWRPGTDYKKCYSANQEMGGGVHLDLIHEIDYLYWLFGRPQKVHSILRSRSELKINAIDYANYNLEYPYFVANLILNYYRKDTKRTLEVLFDDRTIYVDLLSNKVIENEQVIYASEQTIASTYKQQLDYFIQLVVEGQSNSFNSVKEGWETLQICLDYEIKG